MILSQIVWQQVLSKNELRSKNYYFNESDLSGNLRNLFKTSNKDLLINDMDLAKNIMNEIHSNYLKKIPEMKINKKLPLL